MTEDEMVEWHHRLNGCQFEQTSGDGEGQEVWHAGCSPWGCKESDTTQLQNTSLRFPVTFQSDNCQLKCIGL